MRTEVLNATNLTHTYKGGVTALKGVNLSVYENEIVSIVGQNGSGKTTLVRHFNGLLRPTAGSVSLYGQPTEKRTVSQMSRTVGYVFQNPNHQIFSATVREELAVAPKNFKTPVAEYEAAIERVVELMHIRPILNENPLTLDYTTKKIVTIASVLVFDPEVLILDEPTGGLDEAGRIMLSEITRLVHDAGHTVIMISHDMDYVAEHSGRRDHRGRAARGGLQPAGGHGTRADRAAADRPDGRLARSVGKDRHAERGSVHRKIPLIFARGADVYYAIVPFDPLRVVQTFIMQ